jgi:adenine-specific DNA-methyltransferase
MSLANNSLLRLSGKQQHLWNEFEAIFPTERELVSAAIALGATAVTPWSDAEIELARSAEKATPLAKIKLSSLRDLISAGFDPLGEAFCTLRSSADRRENGATYTPGPIVRSMVEWAANRGTPQRIVDPGTGSARFLLQAGETFPQASLIGVEIDPLTALIARANLAVAGFATRSRIILGDYRRFNESVSGQTLYISATRRMSGITKSRRSGKNGFRMKPGSSATKPASLPDFMFISS